MPNVRNVSLQDVQKAIFPRGGTKPTKTDEALAREAFHWLMTQTQEIPENELSALARHRVEQMKAQLELIGQAASARSPASSISKRTPGRRQEPRQRKSR
jgi:hypothetical protein